MNPERLITAQAVERYISVEFAAHLAGRSPRTIRTWARTEAVRIRHIEGRLFVHVGDVIIQSATRGRRRRLPNHGPVVVKS